MFGLNVQIRKVITTVIIIVSQTDPISERRKRETPICNQHSLQ